VALKNIDMKRFVVISAIALVVGFAAGTTISAAAPDRADAGVVWISS
jgi:hypothetical protein